MLNKLKVAKSLYSIYSSGSFLQSTRLSPFLTNSIQYNFSRDNRDQDDFKPSRFPNKNFNNSYERRSSPKRSFDNDRGNSSYQRRGYQAHGQPNDSIQLNSRFQKENSEQNQRQSAYPKRQSNYNDRNTRFRDRDEGESSFKRTPSYNNKRFENRPQRFNNEDGGENSFRRAPAGNKRFENRPQRFNNEEGENSFKNKRFENRNQRFNQEEDQGENYLKRAPSSNNKFENRNQRFTQEEDEGENYLKRAPSSDNKRFENRPRRFNNEEGDQGENSFRRAPTGNKRFENRNQRFNNEDEGENSFRRTPYENKRFENRNQRFTQEEDQGEGYLKRAPSNYQKPANKSPRFMEEVDEDEGGDVQERRPSYGQKRDFQAPKRFNNNDRNEEQQSQSWGSQGRPQRNPRYQHQEGGYENSRAPSYDRKPNYQNRQNSYNEESDNRRQPYSNRQNFDSEKPRRPQNATRRYTEEEGEEVFDRKTSVKDQRQRQRYSQQEETQEQRASLWEKLKDYQVFQDEVITHARDIDFVSEFLKGLVSERIKSTVFEKFYFKNFNFLISEILEGIKENPPSENDTWKLIDILHSNSLIFLNLGQLETSKIQLLQKKLASEINSKIETLPTNKVFDYIESLANFGVKSSVNLGKINGVLTELIRDIDPKILPKLLRYLVQIGYRNEGIIEIITEKIYKNLSEFDLKSKINLLTNLNLQQYKPNKIFLLRLCEAISQDIEAFPYGELYYPHGPGLLFSLTELEKRYTGKGFYMDELDKLYNQIIFSLKRNIEKYTSLELCRISIGLQRCSVYDQELLESISREIMKKDFFGFEEGELSTDYQKVEENIKSLQEKMDSTDQGAKDTKEYKELLVELKNNLKTKASLTKKIRETMNNLNIFSGIVHCFAVFKYYNADFFNLLNQVIELYYLKFLHEGERYVEFLSFQNIPKLIWSLAVLGEPQEVKKSINYLMNILLKSNYKDRMSHVEITQLYYAVIYLRDTGVFDQETIDFMNNSFNALNKGSIKTISMVHLDICKQLENLEIEHTIEERVDQLAVDIILEKRTRDNKKLILDFHGYNHFFRNTEELKGNALFKRKVLESLGHEYVEITIFDWLLLGEDKKTDYIKTLVSKYVDL